MSQKFPKKSRRGRNRSYLAPLFLGLGGLVLLVLAILPVLNKDRDRAAIEVQGAPRLKTDQETIDLGDVKLGKTVEVSFRLTNVGDEPLRFSEQPYIEVVEGC